MILRFKSSDGDRLNIDTEKHNYSYNESDISEIYILTVSKLVLKRVESECDFNGYGYTEVI